MSSDSQGSNVGHIVSLALATLGSLAWPIVWAMGIHPNEPVVATLAGLSILSAAFLLTWGVEVAEMDLPTALAVSILALIAVLPEYAVDATFAWKAAKDPTQAGYAIANMTGGNRLLLGLGWSAMVFLAWAKHGHRGIRLPRSTGTDVSILFLASLYALVPVARGQLTLMDTCVLMSMYTIYVIAAARGQGDHHDDDEEEELVGPSLWIGSFPTALRRASVLGLFVWAATIIFMSAEPFAHALVQSGLHWGIDEFLLVQWVAPLASEAPEFVVAGLLVLRGSIAKGMLALVSSKVNQWTVLVGTLPVVTSIAGGEPRFLPLDVRQQEEVLLTAAQSLFGVVIIANLFLSRGQAALLAVLFLGQIFVPDAQGRHTFALAYLVIAVGIMVFRPGARTGLRMGYRILWNALRGHPLPEETTKA